MLGERCEGDRFMGRAPRGGLGCPREKMKRLMETIRSPRFKRFVSKRRRWFTAVFLVSLPASFLWVAATASSTVYAFLFALPIALVATTGISLLSAPLIWMMTRTNHTKDCESGAR